MASLALLEAISKALTARIARQWRDPVLCAYLMHRRARIELLIARKKAK
mgnify:CR=1 FL=1